MTIGTAENGRFSSAKLAGALRHDWTRAEVRALFDLPFPDLIYQAQTVHRAYFDPTEIQVSTLLSIKTGGCPEDCAYCPQSAKFDTGVKAEKLMDVDAVLSEARAAKEAGASRFCMGAAWRSPKDRDLDKVCAMIEGVRAMGLETCVTLGMLTGPQAKRLKESGLDYYNHNLDTSPEYYGNIITTRTYQDRLDTLEHVPPGERARFVAECARVAGRWVALAGPYDSPQVAAAEEILQRFIAEKLRANHRYLDEHRLYGLPSRTTTVRQLEELGARVISIGHANLDRWLVLMCINFYLDYRHGEAPADEGVPVVSIQDDSEEVEADDA